MTAPAKANPTTPKEWEEYVNSALSTPEKFQASYADGSFVENLKAYQGATNKTMEDLKNEVVEQTQASVLEMFKRNGSDPEMLGTEHRLDLVNQARRSSAASKVLFNEKAPGAGLNGMFANKTDFFQLVLSDPRKLQGDNLKKYLELTNYSEKIPSDGGFLVPEEFRSEILSVALESAVVRPRANVVPMAGLKLKYPAIDFTTEVGEVFGGMQFAWLDEGQEFPESSASFAAIQLNAHKLGGIARVPNELVRDFGAMSSWLQTTMPKGVAQFEDVGFLKGNGVKKPLGALHADNPALIVVNDEGSAQQSGFTWLNALAMYSRLLPESYATAIWVVTPDAFPELATMALPVGTGGGPVWMPDGHGKPVLTLIGLPVQISRKAPAVLGTQGDVSLVDFTQYLIGDAQDVRVDSSEHVNFTSDKTVFRVVERVDGQPQLLSSLTPENGGPTLSSFVQLATRTVT